MLIKNGKVFLRDGKFHDCALRFGAQVEVWALCAPASWSLSRPRWRSSKRSSLIRYSRKLASMSPPRSSRRANP